MYSTKLSVSIHSDTNPNCPIGAGIEETLTHVYDTIQKATEVKLSEITLADIVNEFHTKKQTPYEVSYEGELYDVPQEEFEMVFGRSGV